MLFAGRYELLEQLGEGAMGVVYRARHVLLELDVAVKVLRPQFASDPAFLERFRREAKLPHILVHKRAVTLREFGLDDQGVPYLTMDLCPGVPLSDLIEQGPMAPERALRIASQVLEVLEEAHRSGILHRDIKPDNIMVDGPAGLDEIKILDFGISKLMEASPNEQALTREGTIGTPLYMSPEQAAGEKLDSRSDLYALGIVLYEMLVGTPPFNGENVRAVLMKHLTQPPPPLPSDLPHRALLEPVLTRLLAKTAPERYDSAGALREVLLQLQEQVLHGGTTSGETGTVPRSAAGVPSVHAWTAPHRPAPDISPMAESSLLETPPLSTPMGGPNLRRLLDTDQLPGVERNQRAGQEGRSGETAALAAGTPEPPSAPPASKGESPLRAQPAAVDAPIDEQDEPAPRRGLSGKLLWGLAAIGVVVGGSQAGTWLAKHAPSTAAPVEGGTPSAETAAPSPTDPTPATKPAGEKKASKPADSADKDTTSPHKSTKPAASAASKTSPDKPAADKTNDKTTDVKPEKAGKIRPGQEVNINAGPGPFYVKSTAVHIVGQVPAGCDQVEVEGQPATLKAGRFDGYVRLQPGEQTVQVSYLSGARLSIDKATLIVDTVPPHIEVIRPEDGQHHRLPWFLAVVKVDDDSPLTEVSVNGKPMNKLGEVYQEKVELSAGENTLRFRATDAARNPARAQVKIIRGASSDSE